MRPDPFRCALPLHRISPNAMPQETKLLNVRIFRECVRVNIGICFQETAAAFKRQPLYSFEDSLIPSPCACPTRASLAKADIVRSKDYARCTSNSTRATRTRLPALSSSTRKTPRVRRVASSPGAPWPLTRPKRRDASRSRAQCRQQVSSTHTHMHFRAGGIAVCHVTHAETLKHVVLRGGARQGCQEPP